MKNKIIIELDADQPDSREEAKLMLDAVKMKCATDSYYNDVLRNYFKYAELKDNQYDILEEVREKLQEHFADFLYD